MAEAEIGKPDAQLFVRGFRLSRLTGKTLDAAVAASARQVGERRLKRVPDNTERREAGDPHRHDLSNTEPEGDRIPLAAPDDPSLGDGGAVSVEDGEPGRLTCLCRMRPVVLAQLEMPVTQARRIRRKVVFDGGEPEDDAVLELLHG